MNKRVNESERGATLQRFCCLISHVTRDKDSTRVILHHKINVRKSNTDHSQTVILMLSLGSIKFFPNFFFICFDTSAVLGSQVCLLSGSALGQRQPPIPPCFVCWM